MVLESGKQNNLYQRCSTILLLRRIRLRTHEQALSKRWNTSRLRKQIGTCTGIGGIKWRERPSGRGSNAWRHDGRAERVRRAKTDTEASCLRTQPDADRGTPAEGSEPT